LATRNNSAPAGELVEELDTIFERAAHWIGHHPQLVVLLLAVILVVAALAGATSAWRTRRAAAAEAEISGVWDAYLAAMGAQPGVREVPEPANPELGRKTRAEYAAKLLAAAAHHDRSAAAALGRLEAADLLEKNGDAEGAFHARELAAKSAPRGSGAAAIALSRYAVALEARGQLEAAAEAHAAAGEIDSPGRVLALVDAARGYARLGKKERALELFARAEKLGLDGVPEYERQQLTELRGAKAGQ
jgi:hypothetical protein